MYNIIFLSDFRFLNIILYSGDENVTIENTEEKEEVTFDEGMKVKLCPNIWKNDEKNVHRSQN